METIAQKRATYAVPDQLSAFAKGPTNDDLDGDRWFAFPTRAGL